MLFSLSRLSRPPRRDGRIFLLIIKQHEGREFPTAEDEPVYTLAGEHLSQPGVVGGVPPWGEGVVYALNPPRGWVDPPRGEGVPKLLSDSRVGPHDFSEPCAYYRDSQRRWVASVIIRL